MAEQSEQSKDDLSNFNRLLRNDFVTTLLLLGLIAFSVFAFSKILAIALKTDYPLHTPISPSMQPTLNIGDLLIVQEVSNAEEINADMEKGDIIVFRKPGNPSEFIVHRAIEKRWESKDGKYYFKTKGDNNKSPDQPFAFKEWISEDDIIGKVIWKIPLLGYVKIFLGTPIGMATTLIIFLILIVLESWK